MRNKYILRYKKAGFAILAIVLVIVSSLTFITHFFRNTTAPNLWLVFAIEYHTWIMAVSILASVGFGYFWAVLLYKELEVKTKASKNLLDVVFLFLGIDEKRILQYLVDENGKTTQSEISRLEGMNKVKAYRSLKKLQEKQIVQIIPHGKVRKIELRQDILQLLVSDQDQISLKRDLAN